MYLHRTNAEFDDQSLWTYKEERKPLFSKSQENGTEIMHDKFPYLETSVIIYNIIEKIKKVIVPARRKSPEGWKDTDLTLWVSWVIENIIPD